MQHDARELTRQHTLGETSSGKAARSEAHAKRTGPNVSLQGTKNGCDGAQAGAERTKNKTENWEGSEDGQAEDGRLESENTFLRKIIEQS